MWATYVCVECRRDIREWREERYTRQSKFATCAPCTMEVLDGKRHFDWYGHTNGREIAPGVPVSDPKFCATCQAAGVQRAAHRIMPGGRGLCDEHFRAERGIAPAVIDPRKVQKVTVPAVAEKTASKDLPNCGCGRPGDHRGRCMYRRQKAEPTNGNTGVTPAKRKQHPSGFLEILDEKLQSLKSQKVELEENIRAIETTLRILDYMPKLDHEKGTQTIEKRD